MSGFYTDASYGDMLLYEDHPKIMNLKRGSGYWTWKPYIILMTMLGCDAEYVLYCDSSTKMLWNRTQFTNSLSNISLMLRLDRNSRNQRSHCVGGSYDRKDTWLTYNPYSHATFVTP